MVLAPDGLPYSEVSHIDRQISERIGSYVSGSPRPDDLAEINRLGDERVALTKPKVFDEIRALLAEIATAG